MADRDFIDTFDHPQRCLKDLARSLGWRPLKKGDSRKDEALDWISAARIDKLISRVPDLARVAETVRSAASSSLA